MIIEKNKDKDRDFELETTYHKKNDDGSVVSLVRIKPKNDKGSSR